MSAQRNAKPVTPTVLSVASATVDATWVPWKLSSLAWSSSLMKSWPCTNIVPPKSGAFR